jgi:serine/threonine protein kinase
MQRVIGETVGNYRITDLLSKGGMGAVYTAVHVDIGRKAAVKVLLPAFSERPDSVKRFFAEARATASIGHPGIVEIFDFGRLKNGDAYLIMELLEGEPLTRRLSDPMPVDRALVLMEHITSALDAAHVKGIVHRDLKPANIILVSDPGVRFGERTKLLDFGIAKLTDDELGKEYATRTGTIMGTPAYMAPEQCRGASNVDPRADLYALGCILFHMVCARPPFLGFGAGEIIGMQQFVSPPRPCTFNPDIPPEVEALILRLLEKDPAARLQNAEALLSELAVLTPSASGQDDDGWSLRSRHANSQRPPSSGMRALVRPNGQNGGQNGGQEGGQEGEPKGRESGGPTPTGGPTAQATTGSLPEESQVVERPVSAAPAPASLADARMRIPAPGGDPPTTLNSAVHSAEFGAAPAPARRRRIYAAGLMLVVGLGLGGWLGLMQRGGGQTEVQAAGGEPGAGGPGASAAVLPTAPATSGPGPAPGSSASGNTSGSTSGNTSGTPGDTPAGRDGAGSAQPAASPASAPRPATVTITSDPEDASVYLGEQKLGHTPLTEHVLPEGSHDVVLTVKKRGYRDEPVPVQPGASLHVRLTRLGKGTRGTGARAPETRRPQPSQGTQDPNGTINPFPQ